jgi:hypothetical protein
MKIPLKNSVSKLTLKETENITAPIGHSLRKSREVRSGRPAEILMNASGRTRPRLMIPPLRTAGQQPNTGDLVTAVACLARMEYITRHQPGPGMCMPPVKDMIQWLSSCCSSICARSPPRRGRRTRPRPRRRLSRGSIAPPTARNRARRMRSTAPASRSCRSISRPSATSSLPAASWSRTPTTSPARPRRPTGSRCSFRSSAAAPPGPPIRTRRCSTRSSRRHLLNRLHHAAEPHALPGRAVERVNPALVSTDLGTSTMVTFPVFC